jgi:hypothetical protein
MRTQHYCKKCDCYYFADDDWAECTMCVSLGRQEGHVHRAMDPRDPYGEDFRAETCFCGAVKYGEGGSWVGSWAQEDREGKFQK